VGEVPCASDLVACSGGLPEETVERGHRSLEHRLELTRHILGQITQLGREAGQALGFGRRTHRDAEVSSELWSRAEGVALHDICFD
jgi:hypothetical protein